MKSIFRSWLAAVVGVVFMAVPFCAYAQVTLQVQSGVVSHLDDTAEVAVSLDYTGIGPTAMVIYVAFENARLTAASDYYETVARDLQGSPLHGNDGNVIVTRSAVMPDPAVLEAGKQVDAQFHAALEDNPVQGCVGVVVAGLNNQVLPKGHLFTLALRVLQNNGSTDTITVRGLDAAHPGVLQDRPVFSSASAANGDNLPVTAQNGSIVLGCSRPDAPAGVSATSDRSDGVQIAWQAVSTSEYRVYRAQDGDLAHAQPLGAGWVDGSVFLDESAAQPAVVQAPGCFRAGQYEAVTQTYWVKARDSQSHCESLFSAPGMEGARVKAKSATVSKTLKSDATTPITLYLDAAGLGKGMSLTLEMAVRGRQQVYTGSVSWLPAADGEMRGWAVFYPDGSWVDGDVLSVSGCLVAADGAIIATAEDTLFLGVLTAPVIAPAGLGGALVVWTFAAGVLMALRRRPLSSK